MFFFYLFFYIFFHEQTKYIFGVLFMSMDTKQTWHSEQGKPKHEGLPKLTCHTTPKAETLGTKSWILCYRELWFTSFHSQGRQLKQVESKSFKGKVLIRSSRKVKLNLIRRISPKLNWTKRLPGFWCQNNSTEHSSVCREIEHLGKPLLLWAAQY